MKKVLSYLLMPATVCGISFAAASCSKDDDNDILLPVEEHDDGANSSGDEIGYIECSWNGTKVVKTPQVVNAENLANHRTEKTFPETELTEAAYYVSGKLDMKGTYKIKGGRTVSLILCDGAELKMNYITVDGEGTTLKIFGQEKGTGKLTIEDPDGIKAAIGPGNENGGNVVIHGGVITANGGTGSAAIGSGYTVEVPSGNSKPIHFGRIEIYGGKVFAQGKGYGAGIGAGEDATFGVLGISGGRVDAHAGSGCGPWSDGIGAYHSEHSSDTDGCHIGWAGWERIYIGKGMRLWTYSPNVGYVETVTNNMHWWDFVHQRPQVAFGECDHPGYTEATCPFCYRATLQLR